MRAIQALKVNKITACLLLSHKHFIEAYLDTESYIREIEYQPGRKKKKQHIGDLLEFHCWIKKTTTTQKQNRSASRLDITEVFFPIHPQIRTAYN